MRRIAVAGFLHETNTFAPGKADRHAFQIADSWPEFLVGDAVIAGTRGLNLAIAGAIMTAEPHDVEVAPILWCAAEPSGPVTADAFDWISDQILEGIIEAGQIDGLFLDLHGAMVTERHDDGEGELLARLRKVLGSEFPIGVSLDMHANISAPMVAAATVMTVYRTYPHLDMAETGARCMTRLLQSLDADRPVAAFRQAPFLIPLQAQHTGADPARSLYQRIKEADFGTGPFADMALGFTAADIHDCGPAVIAYAGSVAEADRLADEALDALISAEAAFDTGLLKADEAVARAIAHGGDGPVVIADVQDNPGAGGTSDTTGLLHALVEAGASGAILGVMNDPEFARKAHRTGVGGGFSASLGGLSGVSGDWPFEGRFRVEVLSDGNVPYTGEMYAGGMACMGPSCLVRIVDPVADIRIVVGSSRVQCLDQGLFTHFGVDPAAAKIIVVKSTAHFRADFEPITDVILHAAAPGAFISSLEDLPFQKLRPGVRRL